MAEALEVDVRLDGERVKVFAIDGTTTMAYSYRAELEKRMVVRLPVKAGTREVGILFRKQYRAMEGVGPSRLPTLSGSFVEGLNTNAQFGRIEAGVDSLDIEGPFNAPSEQENPNRKGLLACPQRGSSDERGCAASILSTLARRAYRRPIVDADLRVLMTFFDEGRAAGDVATGIQRALEVILTHPEFLVRVERDPQGIRLYPSFPTSELRE